MNSVHGERAGVGSLSVVSEGWKKSTRLPDDA